ncbi:MAG: InlB B-repeat-containing protein [Erysipelotrichaceae bacterium]|nr:InlB B-repeat-containing protein [Erysipelotrichaceae bacterium]
MKCENKFVVFGLALVLGFSLASCNTQPNDSSSSNSNEVTSESSDLVSGSSEVSTESSAEHVHAYTSQVTKEATCTEDGVMTFTCECNDSYTEVIAALGHKMAHHDAVASTCTTAGSVEYYSCEVCHANFADVEGNEELTSVEAPLLAHSLTYHEAHAATCTSAGNVEYWTCDVCEGVFLDANATVASSIDVTVTPVVAHSLTYHEAHAATCSSTGNVEYWSCDVCNGVFLDSDATVVSSLDDVTTPVVDHDLSYHAAKEPTCFETGNIEYWTCSMCGEYFLNELGTEATTANDVVIDVVAHNYVYTSVVSATIGGSAVVSGACTMCGDRTTLEVAAPEKYALSINSSNVSDYFTVNDTSKYTFVADDNFVLTSNNKGVKSSNAVYELVATTAGKITFDYAISSESNYDYLTVYHIPAEGSSTKLVTTKVSGKNGVLITGNKEATLAVGDTIKFDYCKDSSGDQGSDAASISNIKFEITSVEGLDIEFAVVSYVSPVAVQPVVVVAGNPVETLPEVEVEDKVFKGWFTDQTFATPFTSSSVVSSSLVAYVKLVDKAYVTLHVNNGSEDVVDTVAVGDEYPIPENPTALEGYIFAGWFTSPSFADGTLYETSVVESSFDLYAKYEELPAYVGAYTGFELWGSSVGNGSKSTGKSATVTDLLVFKVGSSERGSIDNLNIVDGVANVTSSTGNVTKILINEEKGILVCNYKSSVTTLASDDIYVFAKSSASITYVNQFVWNSGKERVVEFTLNGATEMIYVNAVNDTINFDVTLATVSGDAISSVSEVYDSSSKSVVVTSLSVLSNGQKVVDYAVKNNELVSLDGVQGTYSGSLGTIVLDGAGNATVDGVAYTYKVVNEVVEIDIANSTKTVQLANGSYSFVADSTAGTYTGDYGTFVSNGDGTGTLDSVEVTYTKSDSLLTIYVGEETKTVLLGDDGTYLTNSIFAGHTFTGSFYSDWDEGTSNLKIVFNDNDGGIISGVIYSGYGTTYFFNFTATYADNTLTFTIVTSLNKNEFAGKVVVATVSGSTITIVSTQISNAAYSWDNQGSATDSTFQA